MLLSSLQSVASKATEKADIFCFQTKGCPLPSACCPSTWGQYLNFKKLVGNSKHYESFIVRDHCFIFLKLLRSICTKEIDPNSKTIQHSKILVTSEAEPLGPTAGPFIKQEIFCSLSWKYFVYLKDVTFIVVSFVGRIIYWVNKFEVKNCQLKISMSCVLSANY